MTTTTHDAVSYRHGDTSFPLVEQTVGDALPAAAPDRTAFVEGTPGPGPRRHRAYAELLASAERVARALLGRGNPMAQIDDAGCVGVEGRLKDMIIRGGENVYPREIEDLLQAHPGVADVAVVGRPDERWGETVAAFVRPAAGTAPTRAELPDWCRAHLAAYKTPVTWVFEDAFPMTASGKIRKNELRERLA